MKKKERNFVAGKEVDLPDGQNDKVQDGESGDQEAGAGDRVQEQKAGVDGEKQELKEDADSEGQEPEEAPMFLIAVYPILYLSHQYKVGDILPANDFRMVAAWLSAGTAVWRSAPEKASKAKPRTAEPGLPGQAVFSEAQDGDDLAGKIPQTIGRKR